MSTEITPPPNQPLHLVLWRGLEPGYYVLLGAAFLGGLFFALFDVSWWRIAVALLSFVLLVVAVLPYRGMRLYRWAWLRLHHRWAVLLVSLLPARRRQMALLSSRLLDAAPAQEQRKAVERAGGETRPLARSEPSEVNTLDWDPAWTASWASAASSSHAGRAKADVALLRSRSSTREKPAAARLSLSGDELDGMPVPLLGDLSLAARSFESDAQPGPSSDPPSLTLRQIRAWNQPADGTRRRE